MLFIVGDVHGDVPLMTDLLRRIDAVPPDGTEKYLIVAGDFGFGMRHGSADLDFLSDLSAARNVRLLFVDGNHENFDYLNSLPAVGWNGGLVHVLREGVLHLMRGQGYRIDGQTIFTFGGAASPDKAWRRAFELQTKIKCWWPQELPSNEEYHRAAQTLQANQAFDLIITHTAPREIIARMGYSPYEDDAELTGFLEWVMGQFPFRHWYFGHFHEDVDPDERFSCLCHRLVRIS